MKFSPHSNNHNTNACMEALEQRLLMSAHVPQVWIEIDPSGTSQQVYQDRANSLPLSQPTPGAATRGVSSVTTLESDKDTILFRVYRDHPGKYAMKVYIDLSGDATLGKDYTASTRHYVVIPAGKTSGALKIKVRKDKVSDSGENAIVTLRDNKHYDIVTGDESAKVAIAEDTVSITALRTITEVQTGENFLTEGQALGSFMIWRDYGLVNLVPSTQPLTVSFQTEGTAVAGTNYTLSVNDGLTTVPVADSATIPTGASSVTVDVNVPQNDLAEGAKNVTFSLKPSDDYVILVVEDPFVAIPAESDIAVYPWKPTLPTYSSSYYSAPKASFTILDDDVVFNTASEIILDSNLKPSIQTIDPWFNQDPGIYIPSGTIGLLRDGTTFSFIQLLPANPVLNQPYSQTYTTFSLTVEYQGLEIVSGKDQPCARISVHTEVLSGANTGATADYLLAVDTYDAPESDGIVIGHLAQTST